MLSQVLNWNWNCLHFGINWSENIKFHHQVTAIVRIQFCESNSTWKLFPCFNWMQHIHLFTKQFQWSKILGTYGMYCSLEVILHDPVQVDVRTLSWPHSGRHIFFGWSLFLIFFPSVLWVMGRLMFRANMKYVLIVHLSHLVNLFHSCGSVACKQ